MPKRQTGRDATTYYLGDAGIDEGDDDDDDDDRELPPLPLPPTTTQPQPASSPKRSRGGSAGRATKSPARLKTSHVAIGDTAPPESPRSTQLLKETELFLSPNAEHSSSTNPHQRGGGGRNGRALASAAYSEDNVENAEIEAYYNRSSPPYNLVGDAGNNGMPRSPSTPSATLPTKQPRPPASEIGPWTTMLESTKGWPKARARAIEALVATPEFKKTENRVASDVFKKIMAARVNQSNGIETPVRKRLGILGAGSRDSLRNVPQTTEV